MTMDRVLAVVAIAMLGGFLGILVWFVPRLDLGAVVAICFGLALFDFGKTILGRN